MIIENTKLEGSFPKQLIPFSQKGKKWRAQSVNWGANKNIFSSSPVRKSVLHKQINYDLLNGKLHMSDLKLIVNPNEIDASFIPENIQHYPIMNTKLQVLKGEESKRVFDYHVVVTNPTAISEIENNKKQQLMAALQELIQDQSISDEDYQERAEKLADYYNYEWQDTMEIEANWLLTHYWKEYNLPKVFNDGFTDAMAVGEEIYQVAIVQGEPTIFKLNPRKVRIYQSGFSNKIEDAGMIVIEDYWSPSRILETFYDVLDNNDIKYIEDISNNKLGSGTKENENPLDGYIYNEFEKEELTASDLFGSIEDDLNSLPYDLDGNIRVCQVYWKSRRWIKKVKSYDPITGEEIYSLHTEDYICNKEMGETEEKYPIPQAWEGTKIGEKLYVNMRPCPIQYNRISNPARCHFGIIGSIYNLNDDKPFSLVDIMKPYNYYYDIIYDRLNKLIARNHGKVIRLDLAKVPNKWKMEQWMSVLKTYGVAVEDSFKEGNKGPALGKLAGTMNNASSGVIDAELGNSIQQHIGLLEFVKNEMSEVAGISKQREGQISNRETVGGVERATLQSSHITEWLFVTHDDVKKRVMECFLETAKIAMRGRNKKFQYITSDMSQKTMDIDGDAFSLNDYGITIDNSNDTQELKNNLPTLVQAGLQNQAVSLSTAIKVWGSSSIAEKARMIEADERKMQQRQQQMAQQQAQIEQQKAEADMQMKQAEIEAKDTINQRDNETKMLIASMQIANNQPPVEDKSMSEAERAKLDEQIKEFNESLAFDKKKHSDDVRLKEKQINKQSSRTTK